MTENKEGPQDIAQCLEKLNQWQEEQIRILFERQNTQRKLLGLEHKKIYEMLGIFQDDTEPLNEEDGGNETSDNESNLGVRRLEQSDDGGSPISHQGEPPTDIKPKKPFLRRKQGLMRRFKMDPDQFRINNLPAYKFSSNHPSLDGLKSKTTEKAIEEPPKMVKKSPPRPVCKSILRLKASEKTPKVTTGLDLMEENFQKSLISSKTACNSTPDMKSQSSSSKEIVEPISWATILDPQNIKPIEQQTYYSSKQDSQDESDNLSIFELLEQKAKNGSFDLNSSYIKRFLRKTRSESNEDTFESSASIKFTPIPNEVYQSTKSLVSESTDSEDDEDVTPRPAVRVRFADSPQIEEPPESISKTVDNNDSSRFFEEFKKLIFANQSDASIADSSGNLAQEILQKAELIKERLQELEAEIATFKQNNLELVKSKQEHELEKAHFEQERRESLEKLNDERIQLEIYLHDERMKIEEDRKKMETQMKYQKSAALNKEKKEVAKLRDEIEALQKELKKKDETHIAAQSRLRAQVRNLEKDVKQLNIELEVVNKENRRLESENLKISRQNNNKMLQEINRNIAKLTPKESLIPLKEEVESQKNSTISQKKSKPKTSIRQTSGVLKKKPSSITRQVCVEVISSGEDSSSTSSDDPDCPAARVTFAKSPTPPDRRKSTEKENPKEESPADSSSFKREIRNSDGTTDIWYPNGNLKKISADGMTIRMLYFNKDIKETNINEGTVKYYYAETNTWHTTYLDGLEILEFPNGQTEHRYKDGKVEIHFPNNSIKITDPSDEHKQEEWRFPDGTSLLQMKNGDKILLLTNGQREIHTALSKRREYPDGTVKLVYPDGSQETRYSNGRVRLKDKDGNLVMDTETIKY